MGTSVTLFKIWGIDMRVHWSFILIVVYYAYLYSTVSANPLLGALYGILLILLLFTCVTLHELGHALVAKYYKINVPHITLLPIGGVASLERSPDNPLQEFFIAIVGPLVNLALAAILSPIALFAYFSAVDSGSIPATMESAGRFVQQPGAGNLFGNLVVTNLILALFNLLPAFPMDGGRILRALLAMAMPYIQATRIAVLIGRIMALVFALLGLGVIELFGIRGGNIFLLLIAFFVYVGGGAELESVESRTVLKNITAEKALARTATSLYASERLSRAVDLLMTTYQTDFPVLDLSGRFIGVLTRGRLVQALKELGPDARIVDVMIPVGQVPVASPKDTLDKIWEQMMQAGSRVVAIMDHQNFLGLLTLDDISEVFQVVGAKLANVSRNAPPGAAPSTPPRIEGAADA
jgi:stage IV sporulation protein FB